MTPEELIDIFESRTNLSRALGKSESAVRNWFLRGSIPAKHDVAIIQAAARRRRKPVTPADLHSVRLALAERVKA